VAGWPGENGGSPQHHLACRWARLAALSRSGSQGLLCSVQVLRILIGLDAVSPTALTSLASGTSVENRSPCTTMVDIHRRHPVAPG
jgi:hypothetical protein